MLTYQFTPDAAFSDGTPLDCDDLVLAWTAMSGRFPEFGAATTAGYLAAAGARTWQRALCVEALTEALLDAARPGPTAAAE